jgi:hypothetical protein
LNLAFSLSQGKRERETDPFQAYKFVSLWEMLEFYATGFVMIMDFLADLKNNQTFFNDQAWTTEEWGKQRTKIHKVLDYHQKSFLEMGLVHSAKRAQKLLALIDSENVHKNHDKIKRQIEDLNEMFVDELRERKLFIVKPDHAKFYRMGSSFIGGNLLAKFSDLREDANEAAACFALSRYTACAFHLMRIMEHTVHKFAGQLDVTFDTNIDTMGDILAKIQKKVNEWDKELQRPGTKKRKYNACCASMRGLVSRRNDIMHVREFYTEERVTDLVGAVKACLEDFLKLPPP